MITLVLGGARSGKSAAAERLVVAHAGPLTYLATGASTDDDMAARIGEHQHRRDERFTTVEAGADLAAALRRPPERPTLVDALGTWVAAHPEFSDRRSDASAGRSPAGSADPWTARVDELCAALAIRSAPTVLVSDEVGLGLHPESAVGRRFRDVLGIVNQRVAEIADDVVLVVAGRALRLDPIDQVIAPDRREPSA